MPRTSSRSAAHAAKSKLTETIEVEVEENSEEAVNRKRRVEEESDFEAEEGEEDEEEGDDHEVEEESNSQTTTFPTTTSKQKKRKLTFIPPLSHHWIPDRVCASASELSSAIKAHNAATKRRNRHFLTKMSDDDWKGGRRRRGEGSIVIEERFLSQVRPIAVEGSGSNGNSASTSGNTPSNPSTPSTPSTPSPISAISPTQLSLSLKLSSPPLSVLWCDCSSCLLGPYQLLLLITATEGIHLFSVTVDPQRGFTEGAVSGGHCAVPFEIDCAALKGGYLCLGSGGYDLKGEKMSTTTTATANVYVINTHALHFSSSATFTIDSPTPAISLPDTHLTCLTLSPLGLLSGSRSGRLRLHSLTFQERLQLALPSAVPVYCAVVSEDGKRVMVSGRMSRVLSYGMCEGGDWVTEASSLALIPKIIPYPHGDSLIYSDCESNARLILSPTHHSPLSPSTPFDSLITSMHSSRLHSIVALGSAKGSVWMAWPGRGLVKRIAPVVQYWRGSSAGAGSGEIEGSGEAVQVAWSECSGTPALMVVVRGAGEVRLMICDEFII